MNVAAAAAAAADATLVAATEATPRGHAGPVKLDDSHLFCVVFDEFFLSANVPKPLVHSAHLPASEVDQNWESLNQAMKDWCPANARGRHYPGY